MLKAILSYMLFNEFLETKRLDLDANFIFICMLCAFFQVLKNPIKITSVQTFWIMVLIIFPCALYADHLSDALTDQVSLLRNLESLLETRSNHLQSTINLLGDLQITTNRIQQLVLDCVFLLLLLYVYVWERWRYTCFYLFVHN